MELTLTHQAGPQIAVACNSRPSHTFDLRQLIPDEGVAGQPREYRRYRHNLTEMRKVIEEMISFKKRWLQVAGILFVLGTLSLGLLVGAIVLVT